jgi:hypothetical protein
MVEQIILKPKGPKAIPMPSMNYSYNYDGIDSVEFHYLGGQWDLRIYSERTKKLYAIAEIVGSEEKAAEVLEVLGIG